VGEEGAVKQNASLFGRGLAAVASDVRAEPLAAGAAALGAVIFAAASVAFAAVVGAITDSVLAPAFTTGRRQDTYLLAVLVGVAALRSVGVISRRYFALATTISVKARYRRELADCYLDAPPTGLGTRPSGQLVAHADSDVQSLVASTNFAPFTIGAAVLLAFAIVRLLLITPLFAVIGIGLLPLVAILNRFFGQRMEGPAADIRQQMGQVSAVGYESVDGAVVVKALGREEAEVARFGAAAAALRDAQVRLGQVFARFQATIAALTDVAVIGIIGVGAWRVSAGAVSDGELVQAVALLGLLGQPIEVFGWFLGELPQSRVARERVATVLSDLSPGAAEVGYHTLPDGPLRLEVRGVGHGRAGVEVLHEVSFDIRPGEMVALAGATASGKTTLLELIVGMDRPDRGEIVLGGVALGDVATDELRRRVGYAAQEAFLFADTVTENIEVGRAVDAQRAVGTARADGFIRHLEDGYDSVVGERGTSLSGGERQRVSLARAVAAQPGLLVLDDALSAVDPIVEATILTELRNLWMTLLSATHRRASLELADRVVFLDRGTVVATGKHDELLADPRYAALMRAYDDSDGAR
jgi:ATP-binding cassette subfamily B protein